VIVAKSPEASKQQTSVVCFKSRDIYTTPSLTNATNYIANSA
jgi:hypothetical protein